MLRGLALQLLAVGPLSLLSLRFNVDECRGRETGEAAGSFQADSARKTWYGTTKGYIVEVRVASCVGGSTGPGRLREAPAGLPAYFYSL